MSGDANAPVLVTCHLFSKCFCHSFSSSGFMSFSARATAKVSICFPL